VPHEPGTGQRAAALLLYALISMVAATLRFRFTDLGGHFKKGATGQAIYCIWHNRLALCLPAYKRLASRNGFTPRMAAMASASKDGAFLAGVLRCFGVHPARGSSSRRGPQALLELTSLAEQGLDLAITPDGPRGPRYVAKPGVISLAQVTSLPIVPCTLNLSRKIHIKSWDAFQVPLPFAACEVVIGNPINVPREASDEKREAMRRDLETALLQMSKD
jgi:lysophospholipid acyltransferase (LPLAT)-like uncharacterized protein